MLKEVEAFQGNQMMSLMLVICSILRDFLHLHLQNITRKETIYL